MQAQVGFGTSDMGDDQNTVEIIKTAIRCGYRLFDGGASYGNEKAFGNGIFESGINRNELVIISKISNETRWQNGDAYQIAIDAFNQSLSRLRLDYVDLYLIHWPVVRYHEENWAARNADTWKAMEDLQEMGKIKRIGISNFLEGHINELLKTAKIMPAVNQIEVHPFYQQNSLTKFCQEIGMEVQSWGLLQKGKLLDNAELCAIAKRCGKTVAQLVLKWCLQKNITPIVKTASEARMKQNLDIFDFEISEDDMCAIAALDTPDGFRDVFSYGRQQKYK